MARVHGRRAAGTVHAGLDRRGGDFRRAGVFIARSVDLPAPESLTISP